MIMVRVRQNESCSSLPESIPDQARRVRIIVARHTLEQPHIAPSPTAAMTLEVWESADCGASWRYSFAFGIVGGIQLIDGHIEREVIVSADLLLPPPARQLQIRFTTHHEEFVTAYRTEYV